LVVKAIDLVDGTHIHADAVLIATGATYKRLGVKGEEDYIGAGVHFCATCDGPFYKGADNVTVIGGGNSATEESLHLLKFVPRVHMLVRGELTASKTAIDKVTNEQGITLHLNTAVKEIKGKGGKVNQVTYETKEGTTEVLETPAAFVFIGQKPNTDFLKGAVRMDEYGFIVTGHDLLHGSSPMDRIRFHMETSAPGLFAAGDCRVGSTKQVASAVGEGASAAIAIRAYLKTI
jgi:thioredoxin reductase (NADPH)